MVDVIESKTEELTQGKQPQRGRSFWLSELKASAKEFSEWEDVVERINEKYRAKSTLESFASDFNFNSGARFNILWSNVQTLEPSLYARTPKPDVERRFKDQDKLARLSSEVLERALSYQIEDYNFDSPMTSSVRDCLLGARGVARVYYEVEFTKRPDPITGQMVEVKSKECAKTRYVYWKDFRHSPSRSWANVSWVGFRTYETKDSLTSRFGKDLADKIPLDYSPEGKINEQDSEGKGSEKRAQIWEIWDKDTKTVTWISEGYPEILDSKPDPLGLDGFFPCPCPLYATLTNDSLVPTPDYVLYQTHAVTLDVIQARVVNLLDNIRANGCYNSAFGVDLSNILRQGDGKLYPVNSFKELTDRGGLDGIIEFAPIERFSQVLNILYESGDREVQKIYEITGISDIVRGASDPRETAKAQQLKGQFGTLRLSTRQATVQNFARDLIALMAEIIVHKFSPQTLRMVSGYDIMPGVDLEDPMEWESIVQLLQNDLLRKYRIDVETDSTIAVDTQGMKDTWTEYLSAISTSFQVMTPVIQSAPELAPYFRESLLATSRVYKGGRALEDSLASSFDAWQESLAQPPPPPPPEPAVEVAQINAAVQREEIEADREKASAQTEAKYTMIEKKFEGEVLKVQTQMQKMQEDFKTKVTELIADAKAEKLQMQHEMQIKIMEIMASSKDEEGESKSSKNGSSEGATPPMTFYIDAKPAPVRTAKVERDKSGLMTGATITDQQE